MHLDTESESVDNETSPALLQAARILCDLQARCACESKINQSRDVGRKVEVLWLPHDFPPHQRHKPQDLQAYRGYVVRCDMHRGAKTHLIKYDDKTTHWTAVEAIKFLN